VILSDVSIQKALAEGRIVIDPLWDGAIQPSSVDLRVDRYFRVFRNDTTPFIDPKLPQEDLTELVEVDAERAFILHPASSCSVPRSSGSPSPTTWSPGSKASRRSAASGSSSTRPPASSTPAGTGT
jgi:hypothetical protein